MSGRAVHCSFCGVEHADTELMFVADIGAMPAAICSDCIVLRALVVETHRKSPKLAASLIAGLNARVERERKDGRISIGNPTEGG
jgi:hypothetical protein